MGKLAAKKENKMLAIPFSVVIPLYNKRRTVAATIKSVLKQKHECFECLVVDDGSTDDSLAAVHQFSDPRLRIISQSNAGVSTARNKGIAESRYDYVAFLDADDYWAPEYLTEMSHLITERPGLSVYFTSYYLVLENRRVLTRESPSIAKRGEGVSFDLYSYFRKRPGLLAPFHTSCCVVEKAAAVAAGGFDNRIAFYEDYDLFARLALNGNVGYLNKALTYYNCRDTGDQRLTSRRPLISQHWANYILDGPVGSSRNRDAQYFANSCAVQLVQGYELDGQDTERVKEILSRVNPAMLSTRSLVVYLCPLRVRRVWREIRSYLRKLRRLL